MQLPGLFLIANIPMNAVLHQQLSFNYTRNSPMSQTTFILVLVLKRLNSIMLPCKHHYTVIFTTHYWLKKYKFIFWEKTKPTNQTRIADLRNYSQVIWRLQKVHKCFIEPTQLPHYVLPLYLTRSTAAFMVVVLQKIKEQNIDI